MSLPWLATLRWAPRRQWDDDDYRQRRNKVMNENDWTYRPYADWRDRPDTDLFGERAVPARRRFAEPKPEPIAKTFVSGADLAELTAVAAAEFAQLLGVETLPGQYVIKIGTASRTKLVPDAWGAPAELYEVEGS